MKQNRINPNTVNNSLINDKNNPYHLFNEVFDVIDNMEIDEQKLKLKFGLSLNQLFNILNNADKRFLTKIHKVWARYCSEFLDEKRSISNNNKRLFFLHECFKQNIFDEEDDLN